MDVPHRLDARRAFLYQPLFSWNMSQTSSSCPGGVDMQPANTSKQINRTVRDRRVNSSGTILFKQRKQLILINHLYPKFFRFREF